MSLRIGILTGLACGVATFTGCLNRSTRSDDDRFRGMIPTSRSKDREKAVAVKPIDRQAGPSLLDPPLPDDRPVSAATMPTPEQPILPVAGEKSADGQAPRIIGRIKDRRDERKNPSPPAKPDEKPELPSPFEKDRTPGPMASGGDFPTPKSQVPTSVPPKANSSLDNVKKVYQLCKQKWDGLKDYEAKLVRREVINGKETPSEEMIFRFRKEPFSVYTKNTGNAGKGREVMYVAGPNAKMHIVTGEGDNRLVGAGFYTQVSPDDRMVSAKSRHKINEGAVGRTVEMLGKAIARTERGEYDGLKSLGLVKRPEYAEAVEGIEAVLAPGQDPELPKGGRREVYFDATPTSPSYGLPVLIRLLEGERELEYYAFSQFKCPANFSDADFDPKQMGKKK